MDPQQAASTTPAASDREIPEGEKALVKQWSKKIEAASNRSKAKFTRFKRNRKLLAGENTDAVDGADPQETAERTRANLHFANMAALLPQVYAKDPEFTCQPTQAVPADKGPLIKQFAITCERMLTKCVVKDANLKRNSKKMLRSAYATSIGWWKASWQENTKTDPIILNRIKDTQDNIDRIQALLANIKDEQNRREHEAQTEELKQALAGLETQQEVVVSRGPTLDFVMAEDILLIDPSIRTITDYQRSGAIAMRVWMTPEQFERNFQRKAVKAKIFSEVQGDMTKNDAGKDGQLLCVWEIWSQDDNRIFPWCEGEEGWAREPYSPDWTGKRWYPFFGGAFNEVDGQFYPLSDVELTEKLVIEYNKNRDDLVRDREDSLPFTLLRAGGDVTDEDAQKIRNRRGNQMITIKGVPGKPIGDDLKSVQLGNVDPRNYDTAPARQDMEMILGGGDASRGAVLKAKTATEAEIVSQGLRGRSAERQDTMEDVLNELGPYMLEMMLRKFSEAEVKALVGDDALWPTLSIEEIFNLVNVEVRGGSTGKPDRLQEQDRWIKLMPIIKDTITAVADLREKGQDSLAEAIIELTRETLRRFDERLDIEQFLPPKPEGEEDPAVLKQMVVTLKAQLEQAMTAAKQAKEEVEKGYVSAASAIATSANPLIAAQAFVLAMQTVQAVEKGLDNPIPPGMPNPAQETPPDDGGAPNDPATTAAPTLQ